MSVERDTIEGSRPDKTIGGSQGDDIVSVCTHISSAGNE